MFFHRRKSYVDPICIFNLFSTSIQRRKGYFQRLTNVILPAGKILIGFGLTVVIRSISSIFNEIGSRNAAPYITMG